MRQLPLSNLVTFEVAARQLSFTKAAHELHLTQGAVSQQIRQLEQRLGFPLFSRHHRRLELTTKGARLALHLTHTFSNTLGLLSELQELETSQILTVSVMPSFATKWLIPRLPSLQNEHPGLQLRIQANDDAVNFKRDRIDVAIVHSHIHNGKHHAIPLLRDKVFPVCSPDFATKYQLVDPQQLRHLPLLNDDSQLRFVNPYEEWEQWLALAAVKGVRPAKSISFNRGDLAIQAAIAGQGVALGRTPLVMDDIKAARLVQPFNIELDNQNCYLFVCPEDSLLLPHIQSFLHWLKYECCQYSPQHSLFAVENIP